MKPKDCFKGFNDNAISKVVAPSKTCEIVLKKLQKIAPPIYQQHIFIERPTGIPQYRVVGTEYYQRIVGVNGQNGKGHTKEQSLASGLMEMVERYSCYRYLNSKYRIFSWKEIASNPFSIDGLYSQFLDEGQIRIIEDEEVSSAKVRWFEGYNLEGKKVYLPMGLIGIILQGTNGMAAGNSREEALLHAICEVIERHCLTLIKYNGLQTPLINQDTISSPIARDLLEKCRSIDENMLIKDFSLGLGLPVIGAITRFSKNECLIKAGVATNREEALIRALTETSQSSGVSGELNRMPEVKHCFDNPRSISFEEIPCIDNDNILREINSIKGLLMKQGMEIFYVDTTDETLNIPSVYAYITGAKFSIKSFNQNKDITDKNILVALIEESFAIGDLEGCRKYIAKGIDLGVKDQVIYHYYKGVLLSVNEQYEKAITCLSKVLNMANLSEVYANALKLLGICYEATDNIDSAINVYTRLLDLTMGEGAKSLEKSSRVLTRFPKNRFFNEKSLYEEVRAARWRSHRMKQSIFIKVFYVYQKKRNIFAKLLQESLAYFENGQYDLAISEAKKALTTHSFVEKIYNLHLILASCHLKNKKHQKAINELRKAEKIDPDDEKINFYLARCYKSIQQTERYQEELDKGFRKLSTLFHMKINLFVKPEGRVGWLKKVC